MDVAVFHKIGEPNEDHTVNSLEQILGFKGEITFDGAYRSIWEHREILGKREPILFVQEDTVRLGNPDVLTWEEILALRPYGFILGWHGKSHRRLTELPDHVIIKELTAPPLFGKLYAYPHGDWSEHTAELVKQMGYLRAYSTTQGEGGNDFAIPRRYL